MTQLIPAFAAGWLLCFTLVIICHLLWNDTAEEVRYLLGGGAICSSCSLAGYILQNDALIIGPWAIASAGLTIVLIQWFERRAKTREANAQKNGEIVGLSRGLTQEIIDSGHKEPRSRN